MVITLVSTLASQPHVKSQHGPSFCFFVFLSQRVTRMDCLEHHMACGTLCDTVPMICGFLHDTWTSHIWCLCLWPQALLSPAKLLACLERVGSARNVTCT